MTELAKRFNAGKPEVASQIAPSALREEAKVMMAGAKKYGAHNWRKGGPISQYLDCAMRHLLAIAEGEDVDPETGCLHAAHVRTNMAFVIELSRTGKLIDDRYYPPKESVS